MTEASSNRQYPLPETIEFIWAETRGAVDAQLEFADSLDSKAFQAIGVGTALIGLVAVGAEALLAEPSLARWFLALAVLFYVLSALFTVITISTMPRLPATAATNALTAAWLPRSRYSVSTGTNASAKVASANSRRKKLGIRNAR